MASNQEQSSDNRPIRVDPEIQRTEAGGVPANNGHARTAASHYDSLTSPENLDHSLRPPERVQPRTEPTLNLAADVQDETQLRNEGSDPENAYPPDSATMEKMRRDLIKEWKETLNFMLVTSAILSAIVTAFIIKSIEELQPDLDEDIIGILLQGSNYTFSSFSPTPSSIAANSLFIASLCVSIIATFTTILALQWVSLYTVHAKANVPMPTEKAFSWSFPRIIRLLPWLLHVSVFLLFAGLAAWVWGLDVRMWGIISGVLSVAILLYGAAAAVMLSHSHRSFQLLQQW